MFSFLPNFFVCMQQAVQGTSVKDLIESWENKPITSCVIGISKIGFTSKLSVNISHAAILLLNKEIDYVYNDDKEFQERKGILIEYGDYNPNMSEGEKKFVEKGYVIYPYGEKGGLRYYVKQYGGFIKEFGDIGYIDLNIEKNNQQRFESFLNKIAKLEDNKWIQSNYSNGFTNNFNSQNFVIEALKELKPYFNMGNVYPNNPNLFGKSPKQKLDFIPSNIKTELMNYYRI